MHALWRPGVSLDLAAEAYGATQTHSPRIRILRILRIEKKSRILKQPTNFIILYFILFFNFLTHHCYVRANCSLRRPHNSVTNLLEM